MQWLPRLAKLSLITECFTLSQTFWSRRKRTRSFRNGVVFVELIESFLPPAIKIALLQGRYSIVCPNLAAGGVPPVCLRLTNSP